ncbi:anti-sigma factor [Candidatus Poriferisocius sp.]|uniref:anti-sigma factor n=1 Tax=Candidatus Poriferisocius sp. TaxID=3101276 RepID=UPI003B01A926
MSEKRRRWEDSDIEAALRDMGAEEIELLEPPLSVWDGIQEAVGGPARAPGAAADLQSRRRRIRRAALAAAAVMLIAAGTAATVAVLLGDSPPVVAAADLAHDPGSFDPIGAQAHAGANLVDHGDRHTVEIVDASLPAPGAGADLEVWLIRPGPDGGVSDLVSLGVVGFQDPGSLEVPKGYDPDSYYVVDISIESRDGDPSHSGRSILRGPFRDV